MSYYFIPKWVAGLGPKTKIGDVVAVNVVDTINKWGKDWEASTYNKCRGQILALMNYAAKKTKGKKSVKLVGDPYIKTNPLDGEIAKYDENRRLKVLAPDDVFALRAGAPARMADVISALWYSMLRIGNVLEIRRRDFHDNGDRGLLTIPKTKNGTAIQQTVSGRWFRLLRRQARRCTRPDDRLFPGPHGRANAYRSWKNIFPGVVREAGYEPVCDVGNVYGVSAHSIRHASATHALRTGAAVTTVASMGGWKHPDILLKNYAHAMDKDVQEAFAGLDDALPADEETGKVLKGFKVVGA